MGTEHCDSYSGICECWPNVVGDKCDRCEIEHYGFSSGEGCTLCDCQIASESSQCDDTTGQCRCKRGVTGRTCDRCAPGFWNYTADGCLSCGCNTEYSLGFGCNAKTGQCECLPGVIGEKCDHCPYRWVLIENHGCFECDSCTHDLLDVTDELKNITYPVIEEFENVASGYFTSRRLIYINNTVNALKPAVDLLDPQQGNILNPLLDGLEHLEQELKNLNRKSNFTLEHSDSIVPQAGKLKEEARNMLDSIRESALQANQTILEVDNLGFENGEGPKIDQALEEGQQVIKEIKNYNFTQQREDVSVPLDRAIALLQDMNDYYLPVGIQWEKLEDVEGFLKEINDKLADISNYTRYTVDKVAQAEELNMKYRGDLVKGKISTLDEQAANALAELKEAHSLLTNASRDLAEAHRAVNKLNEEDTLDSLDNMNRDFNSSVFLDYGQLDPLEAAVAKANNHSEHLIFEVITF